MKVEHIYRPVVKPIKQELETLVDKYHRGNSIHNIAKDFGVSRPTIRYRLRRLGVYKQPTSIGVDTEYSLKDRLTALGHTVKKMPTNHPYDLLVDGLRVDVKVANATDNNGSKCYNFQLQDSTERISVKDLEATIDLMYLVFLDMPKQPVFAVSTENSLPKFKLNIPASFNSKYQLEFVCNLQDEEDKDNG